MSVFTEKELAYLAEQRLGRIATLGATGHPHVVPVGFRHNPDFDTIDVGGHGIAASKKYRDVARDGRVAFVVDDVPSTDPWRVRGIEIRGDAVVLATGGEVIGPGFAAEVIRISPQRIVAWGIDSDDYFTANPRTVR